MKAYPKAFFQVTFILNHKKIKDIFCWTQALSFMLRLFGKRGADTFAKRSQGLPSRKLAWWQYADSSVKPVAALGNHRLALVLTSDFVCVSGESYESWLAFPAWLSLKEPLDFCKKKKRILPTVVFGTPTGESRFRNGNSRQTTEAKGHLHV